MEHEAKRPYVPRHERGVEKVFVTSDELTNLLNETRRANGITYGLTYTIESWGFDPLDTMVLPPSEDRRHVWLVWKGR